MTSPDSPLTWAEFEHVEMRVGVVLACELNSKARVPAYVLRIDLGPLGERTSSAQLTRNYAPDELVGRQVICVMNFEPKRVAGVKSEVLVLGALDESAGTILLGTERPVEPGSRIA